MLLTIMSYLYKNVCCLCSRYVILVYLYMEEIWYNTTSYKNINMLSLFILIPSNEQWNNVKNLLEMYQFNFQHEICIVIMCRLSFK